MVFTFFKPFDSRAQLVVIYGILRERNTTISPCEQVPSSLCFFKKKTRLIKVLPIKRAEMVRWNNVKWSWVFALSAMIIQLHFFTRVFSENLNVKNHGVPEAMIDNMLNIARTFFKLPESERLKSYSDDPSKSTRLSTSFNVRTEKVANWRDFLRLHCYPLQDFIHEWPTNPPSFREDVAEYCTSVRGLVLRLLEAISEGLELQKDYIDKTLSKHGQHMALNYYPPCPQPELTYGLPGHTDPNLITILLQNDVPGRQVLRNGKWVAVNPIPNTIGDQMQVRLIKDACMSSLMDLTDGFSVRKDFKSALAGFHTKSDPVHFQNIKWTKCRRGGSVENIRPGLIDRQRRRRNKKDKDDEDDGEDDRWPSDPDVLYLILGIVIILAMFLIVLSLIIWLIS